MLQTFLDFFFVFVLFMLFRGWGSLSLQRSTSSKTLFSSFTVLHIKSLKRWSQTLVKSLFGMTGQPVRLLSVLVERGKMGFCSNRLLLESAGRRQTVFSVLAAVHILTWQQLMLLTYIGCCGSLTLCRRFPLWSALVGILPEHSHKGRLLMLQTDWSRGETGFANYLRHRVV